MSEVGKPLPHESARGHVTGSARYTDDLAGELAGVLHAWPVQSPHAHARVLEIDASAALRQAGVVAVLTARDVPGENQVGVALRDEALFPDLVQHHGQAVAWVVAESEEAARQAALCVQVRYEALTPILSLDDARTASSWLTDEVRIRRGHPEAQLRTATRRVQGEVATGAQEHFYLETHAALASWDGEGGVYVRSSTQHPTETQTIVARVLGLPRHAVVCESLRMGGGFGGKEVQANAFAAIAALGAHVTRRPVRVRLDRRRDVMLTGKRHPFVARYDVGFEPDGRLVALVLELVSDGGYSVDLSKPIMQRALFHVDNAYFVPHLDVVGRVAKTHKTSQTAFRGFGGPQGMVIIEEVIDRVARETGLAPHVVRERNFYREGDTTHYGQPVKDAERIARIHGELMARASFEARRAEIAAFNASSHGKKRGLAFTPVKFGISFTTSFFNQAGAFVLVYPDGSVQVNHGGTEMGQGLHTKMRQVAADALGVTLAAVRIMPTRTDKVPNTSATAASSGADLNGAAVADACHTLKARLAEVAGRMLDAFPEDLVFAGGRVSRAGRPERALDFARVVQRAYLDRVSLSATGFYRTPDLHFDEQAGRGNPFHYFAYGAAVSEVEVDGATGELALLRVDIVHDVGCSLSPLVDRGQVEGGFVQGVGWLTREDFRWDAAGRIATVGASTYKLPTLHDVPEAFSVHLLERADEPTVIRGSKAVGEPPLMLAISVREALRDAVAAFADAPPKHVPLACPSTPEALLWAIDAVRS